MTSTAHIGNPVYVVTDKQTLITYRVRAHSENKACAKIARRTGKASADFRAYEF